MATTEEAKLQLSTRSWSKHVREFDNRSEIENEEKKREVEGRNIYLNGKGQIRWARNMNG